MDEFDYCELKFETCVCRKNGKCICALVEREFQDPALVESARLNKAEKERAKRAKYIDEEPPSRYGGYIMPSHAREMMRAMMMTRFTPPVIRKELLDAAETRVEFKSPFVGFDEVMRERPSWADIDFKQVEDRIRRTLLEKKYIQQDMAIIDELSFMKPNPREDGQSLRERRAGIADLPKEKRKPHHAFLEDSTRRRRK